MSKIVFYSQLVIFFLLAHSYVFCGLQDFEQRFSINGGVVKKFVCSHTAQSDFAIINNIARGLCNGRIQSRNYPFLKQLCIARECDDYIEGSTTYQSSDKVDTDGESIFDKDQTDAFLSRFQASLAVTQNNHFLSCENMRKFITVLHGLRSGTIVSGQNKISIEYLDDQEQQPITLCSKKRVREDEHCAIGNVSLEKRAVLESFLAESNWISLSKKPVSVSPVVESLKSVWKSDSVSSDTSSNVSDDTELQSPSSFDITSHTKTSRSSSLSSSESLVSSCSSQI